MSRSDRVGPAADVEHAVRVVGLHDRGEPPCPTASSSRSAASAGNSDNRIAGSIAGIGSTGSV
jgi:hypothetical protein